MPVRAARLDAGPERGYMAGMKDTELDSLLEVMEEVARGEYSDRIMGFTRPGNDETLRRLAEAVGMMMVKVEAREHRLEGMVDELAALNERLRRTIVHTVGAMARALAARDAYTLGHVDRVARYAERLARRVGLDDAETERVRVAAELHDIGKIGFSDKVFNNPDTRPSPEIMEEIRAHPAIAGDILGGLDFLGPSLDYVLAHHERLDGQGYPRGLKGDDIPMGARIIAVADCFDAMTTDRSYQKGMGVEKAAAILRTLAGPSLDPDLVEAFIAEVEENGMETAD